MAYGSASVDTFNTSTGQVFSPASSSATMKNRIINGDHRIDQRNAGNTVTVSASTQTYITDRFSILTTASGSKVTAQQNAGSVTPPPGFSNYLGITSSSAYTAGASELFRLFHTIEGYNIADLAWGTSSAKPITISFWARSSLTGNFGICLQNASNNRAYAASYSIPVANTWTYCSITIPGETTGTWGSTNGVGIAINFDLGSGGWGAFEIVGRYSEQNIDDKAFTFGSLDGSDTAYTSGTTNYQNTAHYLYSDPKISASKAQTWTAGINWYLSPQSKIALNYSQTSFNGGGGALYSSNASATSATNGYFADLINRGNVTDRADEKVLLVRYQIAY